MYTAFSLNALFNKIDIILVLPTPDSPKQTTLHFVFMTTGIAYSEPITLMNLNGGPDYILDLSDKKGHCGNILKSDLGYNIGDAINNFNRSIHIYLKYCVYIRIIFLRNSWIKNYFIAAIFVFLFAALWCGIYIGMYFFFIAACIIYQFHFNLELFAKNIIPPS